ncbi:hypothetical protein G6F57_021542 [Rhizopus arrhizus]|nr:hypothetical protein G6F57_021542 [Rhizopus arrhizus]
MMLHAHANEAPSSITSPITLSAVASHCPADRRSFRISADSGITQIEVAYAMTDARPGATYCRAHSANAVQAPICSNATPATSGHSWRVGKRKRPIAPSTSTLISAADPKRLAASHSGLMCARPNFMTAQLPPQTMTAPINGKNLRNVLC